MGTPAIRDPRTLVIEIRLGHFTMDTALTVVSHTSEEDTTLVDDWCRSSAASLSREVSQIVAQWVALGDLGVLGHWASRGPAPTARRRRR